MTTGHRGAYEGAADDSLAAMFYDPAKIDMAIHEYRIQIGYYPDGRQRVLYEVMCGLRQAGQDIIDTLVLSKAGSRLTQEWLLNLLHTYVPAMGAAFDTNCRLLADYGLRCETIRLLQNAQQQLSNPDGKVMGDVIRGVMDSLGGSHTAGGIKGVTAGESAVKFESFMAQQPSITLSTGIDWLQEQTGGFAPGDLWWIASAYKMRKTTLMLNLAIQSAISGASVAFMSREVLERNIAAQLVSMFSMGYLLENGLYDATNSNGQPLNWISARGLLQAQVGYRKWDKRKVAAVDYGIAEYRKIQKRMRIYDSSDTGGRLSDIASLESVLRRDIALYNTQIVFVDYLQLFDAPGQGLFDKVMHSARLLQERTKRHNLTMIVAAQKNEESIRGSQDNYSPGVKGGGDVAATADFLLETRYKYGDLTDEKKLEVTMKLSRHGSGGSGVKRVFDIHPGSGLILEGDYATGKRRQYQAQSQQSIFGKNEPDRKQESIRVQLPTG